MCYLDQCCCGCVDDMTKGAKIWSIVNALINLFSFFLPAIFIVGIGKNSSLSTQFDFYTGLIYGIPFGVLFIGDLFLLIGLWSKWTCLIVIWLVVYFVWICGLMANLVTYVILALKLFSRKVNFCMILTSNDMFIEQGFRCDDDVNSLATWIFVLMGFVVLFTPMVYIYLWMMMNTARRDISHEKSRVKSITVATISKTN